MEKIDYSGTVYLLDHKYPEPLLNHSVKKLGDLGMIGNIVVEVFPYHLEIARVRTIRNDSFISGSITTIELKTDTNGKYID